MCKGKQQMKFWKSASAAIVLVLSTSTNAALVTISFQGALGIGDYDDGLALWGSAASDTAYDFSASMTYNTSAVTGALVTSSSDTRYEFQSPANINWIKSSLTVNGITLTNFNQYSDSLEYAGHRTPGDFHYATFIDGSETGGDVMRLVISLDEWGNSIIPMDGSLLAADVASWGALGESYISFNNTVGGTSTNIWSNLTNATISVSAVPVPAAVWLFGSGLLGLVGLARRKA